MCTFGAAVRHMPERADTLQLSESPRWRSCSGNRKQRTAWRGTNWAVVFSSARRLGRHRRRSFADRAAERAAASAESVRDRQGGRPRGRIQQRRGTRPLSRRHAAKGRPRRVALYVAPVDKRLVLQSSGGSPQLVRLPQPSVQLVPTRVLNRPSAWTGRAPFQRRAAPS